MPVDLLEYLRPRLEGFVNCADSYREQHPDPTSPLPTSPMAAEVAQEATLAGAPPWGDDPVYQAYAAAALQLTAAEDYLRGMVRLLEQPITIYSLAVVGRAALEACARSWWLHDPAIDHHERVGRAMTERLYAMTEDSKVARHADPTAVSRLAGRIDGILAAAAALGFRIDRPERKAPFVGQPRPYSTTLIADLLSVRGGGQDLGEVVFRHLSGVHHATIGGLTSPLAEPGHAGSQLLRPGAITHTVTAVALAYTEAFGRALERYGWDPEMWEQWVRHALGGLYEAVEATRAASG